MKHSLSIIPAVLALALSTANAQSTTPGTGSSVTGGGAAPAAQAGTGTRNLPTKKDDQVTRGDRKFIETAGEHGMFEVQIAQLAASKASDPQVKSYASMLVDHHSAANHELVKIANARAVELPAAPPRGLRKDIEKLGKKSGADFDKEFVREVGIKAHEQDIKRFEKASKEVKDAELKAFVDKTLPVLRQHLAAAQALPQSGVTSKTSSAGNHPGSGGTGTGSMNPAGRGT